MSTGSNITETLLQLMSELRQHERADDSKHGEMHRMHDSLKREISTERQLSDDRLETVMRRFDRLETKWDVLAELIRAELKSGKTNGSGGDHG